MIVSIAVAGMVAGFALLLAGAVRREPPKSILGAAIVCYALTLDQFGPLLSSAGREPITTEARTHGAEYAVLGGLALTTLSLAVIRADRTGLESWTDRIFRRQLVWLGGAAAISVLAIQLALNVGGPWPPTVDFLNDFGHHLPIVVYQLVFLLWVGGPTAALGFLTWAHSEGFVRYVFTVGCTFGFAWSAWKLLGVLIRYAMDRRIPIESPVSVALGAAALGTVLLGLLVLAGGHVVSPLAENTIQRFRAWREDLVFYRRNE